MALLFAVQRKKGGGEVGENEIITIKPAKEKGNLVEVIEKACGWKFLFRGFNLMGSL
jgi:hypothetical protein